MASSYHQLLSEIRSCRICAEHLPLGPKPVLSFKPTARLLVVGQAPGTKVHATGIPWNDPSGDRLREWLKMDRGRFYDANHIAIVPMGFCYPGRGKSGDLPPRPECARAWSEPIHRHLKKIELTLLIGKYAQDFYLGTTNKLTDNVRNQPGRSRNYFALPHPSPRNNIWLKKNAWFEAKILPELRKRVGQIFC